jgi:subtilase family serine protease
MQLRKWAAVFALTLIPALSAPASGRAPVRALNLIERYGNVFARNACDTAPDVGEARCFAKLVTDSTGKIRPGKRSEADLTPNIVPQGYGPADLRSAYKVSGGGSSSYTIAIVDAYGYARAEQDLAIYRQQYGLPPCTTANGCFKKVNQNGVQGTYPRANTGWAQEQALDLDMASAMCPNCKILLVQTTNSYLNTLAAGVNTAYRLGAKAISNSYGGSEGGTTSYEGAYNHPGVAITVSSGDYGYGVQFPASSPHVTAVGGTSLSRASNTRGWSETVWNGAGSGCSSVYAKPTWQHDALCARRTVADVSAVANPQTGVAVYGPTSSFASGWMIFGGTSVAAPLIAGIYGVNAIADSNNANLYKSTSHFDVTSGSNGSCGGTYLCTGAVGYDGPTGLGTPNGVSAY